MATQEGVDLRARVQANVRSPRDNLLESFGVTAATVTEFNFGENSLGYEIDPDGEQILIKGNVALAQLSFYALPTVSVFEFEGDTLRIRNSDFRAPIDYYFLIESTPGGPLPSFSLAGAFPNREEKIKFGVSPSGFFAEYTYEYDGLVMGDVIIPSFRTELIANWRSAVVIAHVVGRIDWICGASLWERLAKSLFFNNPDFPARWDAYGKSQPREQLASVFAEGAMMAAPVPRAGQMAPNRQAL